MSQKEDKQVVFVTENVSRFGLFSSPRASQKIFGATPYSFEKAVVLFLPVKDNQV